ncbi:FAD-dependent monooxygenase [Mesorhizobium metallidurans]|uniref:FAD-dependent monooxygenase n=1 Tax=Mesorhizobium metallidurans TaxID=489722 RepID=UPI003CC719C4
MLVSGAGIAGPAVAYWLGKHGFTPTIVEIAPQLRTGGFAIDVRGPGADVVKKMTLWPQVQALSTNFKKFVCVDGDGRTVAVLKVGALRQALEMDEFWVEVMRTDLSRLLYDQTRQKVEYLFGDSIKALSDDGDSVDVTFESGTERRFDLVIGADGQRSNVRNLAFGEDVSFEKYLGYYVAVAAVETSEPSLHTALVYSEPGRGVYLYRPTDRHEALAFFLFTQKEKLDCGPHEPARHKEILAHGMRGMGWEAPELVAKAMGVSELYFDSVSQIRMPSWSKGRVALLGDAAFAPSFLTGQGTQLALTSAYILAGELKRAQGDHARAFAAYEAALKPLVEAAQKQIGGTAPLMIPKTRLGIWLRNRIAPLAVSLLTATASSWKGLLSRKPSSLIGDY